MWQNRFVEENVLIDVAITTEEITFPLCLLSVVRRDARIKKETKQNKKRPNLRAEFCPSGNRLASGFFKNVFHPSSTSCSFGLLLTDSILFPVVKNNYFIYNLETSIQFVNNKEVSQVGIVHYPCQSTACCPVDGILYFCLI